MPNTNVLLRCDIDGITAMIVPYVINYAGLAWSPSPHGRQPSTEGSILWSAEDRRQTSIVANEEIQRSTEVQSSTVPHRSKKLGNDSRRLATVV